MTSRVIVGLGNPVLGDDAVGLHVATILASELAADPSIAVKQLHAGGIRVMDAIDGFDEAVIVDAMCTGAHEPGSIRRLELDDLGAARNIASTHDTNLPTALELGRMLGMRVPSKITIFGIEALEVGEFSESLSESVAQAVPRAVRLIAKELGS
jgi:hydrogenase maturation protease